MKKTVLFILLGAVALGSCKKVVERKNLDKQILLPFLEERIDTDNDYFEASSRGSVLKDFDKRDYQYIDSITLNVGIMTYGSDTAYVRLYNITDDEEVPNAVVKGYTNGLTGYVEFNSNNILKYLPEKSVSLAVQIKCSSPGRTAFGLQPHLKLRRK